MIASPTSVPLQVQAVRVPNANAQPAKAVSPVQGAAVQGFKLGVNTALLTALVDRGEDPSGVTMQRLLQAYGAPPASDAPIKLRRDA